MNNQCCLTHTKEERKERFTAMVKQYIKIRGANEHNLKHISLDIPRNELVVLTGLIGSGKSSLAFDTIYAEGQRRYMPASAFLTVRSAEGRLESRPLTRW